VKFVFVYKPAGARERRWPWRPGQMKLEETELIETLWPSGVFWEWSAAVEAGSMRAQHVLLFVLLRRDIPELDYDAVSFIPDEVGFAIGEEEQRAALEGLDQRLAAGETLDAAEASLRAKLRADLGMPEEPIEGPKEPVEPHPAGQAVTDDGPLPGPVPSQSPLDGDATSGSSPTS
jgi:hypothetical protein